MKMTTLSILISTLFTVSAWAGNGLNPIGQSSHTRAMGGAGVGHFTTASGAVFKNMSLLSQDSSAVGDFSTSFDFDYLVTNFDVKFSEATPYVSPKSQRPIVPFISMGYKLNDSMSIGAGLTFSGSAMDWTDLPDPNLQSKSEITFMSIPVGMSYKLNERFSFGANIVASQLNAKNKAVAQGLDADETSTAFGFDASASVVITDDITAGFTYKSKIAHEAKNFANIDIHVPNIDPDDVKFDLPQEIALGVGYNIGDSLSLAFDYRMISWADTAYLGELGWKDQNVFAFGVEYRTGKKLSFRAGYNHANTPIEDNSSVNALGTTDINGTPMNNAVVAGALASNFVNAGTSHATWGFGYEQSETLAYNMAFVHMLEKEVTMSGPGVSYKNKVSQTTIMAGVDYKF